MAGERSGSWFCGLRRCLRGDGVLTAHGQQTRWDVTGLGNEHHHTEAVITEDEDDLVGAEVLLQDFPSRNKVRLPKVGAVEAVGLDVKPELPVKADQVITGLPHDEVAAHIRVIRRILAEHGDSLQHKKSLLWMGDGACLLTVAYDEHGFLSGLYGRKKSPGVLARGAWFELTDYWLAELLIKGLLDLFDFRR